MLADNPLFYAVRLTQVSTPFAPMLILNINGFYDSLIALVDSLIANNAAIPEIRGYFDVVDTADDELI